MRDTLERHVHFVGTYPAEIGDDAVIGLGEGGLVPLDASEDFVRIGADLGVVIRTLATAGGDYVLGTGGGITVRSELDEEYAETTVKFLKATIRGWAFARDNPQEAADHVTEAGSTLGVHTGAAGIGDASRSVRARAKAALDSDSEVDAVTLVPTGGWYAATFHAPGIWCDLYVDIATPGEWHGDVLRAVDLDLDVVRGWTGRIWVDDEDEFAEHRVRFGYPAEVVELALTSCEAVRQPPGRPQVRPQDRRGADGARGRALGARGVDPAPAARGRASAHPRPAREPGRHPRAGA